MGRLLERDRERALLCRLVDGTLGGRGALLVVEGDAGIGKTGLVREAEALAGAHGVRVLAARGAELEGELAFGVVRSLLERVAADRSWPGAAALAGPVLSGAEADQDLFATLHGLYWLVAEVSDLAPLLLVVDDAHWCDPPSLRFLAYLAHRLGDMPVSLLVATRPDTDPARSALLAALAAESTTGALRPEPLGADAVRALVVDALGEPDRGFVTQLCAVSGGNPFLVCELLAELGLRGVAPRADAVPRIAATVPREVERAVGLRLARLGDDATGLARAAAVLGDGVELRRAAAVAGLGADEVVAAADALVRGRLVEHASRVTFRHPLVRSAVTATLGPAELAALHRRAAVVLADDGERGDVLVPHLLADRPRGDADVVRALRDAAARATGRGAPDVAVRYLRRALAEPPAPSERSAVLFDLGVAAMWAGDPEALDVLTRAAEEADDVTDRARARLFRARLLFEYGRILDAVAACEQGIAELGDTTPDLARELEAQLLTAAIQDHRTRAIARRRQAARAEDPAPIGPTECMLTASIATEEMLLTRSRERALALAEDSLAGGYLVDDRTLVTLPSALLTLAICGQPERARRIWDTVVDRRRARGNRFGVAGAASFRGHAAHLAGDVARAVADLSLGLDLAAELDNLMMRAYASAWLVEALVDAGDLDGAAATSARADGLVDQPLYAANYLLAARGRMNLARGHADEAVADLRAVGARLDAWGARDPAPCAWRASLTLALLARGDEEAAREEGAAAVEAARRWGEPAALAEALRVAGLATPSLTLLEEAVAAADGAPLARARALVDLGAAHRRHGDRVAAREPLREGLDLALDRGAEGLARRARDELVATGARPRRLRRSGTEALTPTERRVADLAAQGSTSRAVAQALFVSEKTVETHLGSVYRKLGITARSQLADALRPPSPAAGTRR
ncbi:regulatory LuxR family protein [Actinomycetospora succinea]|uniref:Regulatory LuxR family protein n=1 Tax=Actinomycetospora succinea TaxID=663603 RepID=A0A4R6V1C0_9PSEU|nr:LuxR family transcriptional regulator [Actinomycetospora succinea]TDQ53864.1 regulatory LuxR family protein [Actinomycetospora succinea]